MDKFLDYQDIENKTISNSPIESVKTTLLQFCQKTSDTDFFDIFISHSYRDAKLIKCIYDFIKSFGYEPYVDWINDEEMNRSNVTLNTVNRLKKRMDNSNSLFIIASEYQKKSYWIPWEIGYFDARHSSSQLAILPIDNYDRNFVADKIEFVGLYPFVYKSFKMDGSNYDKLWIGFETKPNKTGISYWLQSFKV